MKKGFQVIEKHENIEFNNRLGRVMSKNLTVQKNLFKIFGTKSGNQAKLDWTKTFSHLPLEVLWLHLLKFYLWSEKWTLGNAFLQI